MKDKQYMLIVLDGVGINEETQGNAVKAANTPNIDKLMNKYPNSNLNTSGEAVGLPEGQMGNSEVGHMSIGAGRVIYQDLTLISKEIREGDFFKNKTLKEAYVNVKSNDKALHIFGLLSDGGVHSHIEHIIALFEMAKKEGITKVYLHAFMDGRDTPPTSGLDFVRQFENAIKEIGVGKIATVTGRFYAMDRDKRWERVKLAYDAIVLGEGKKSKTAERAIENSYESQVFDEFISPIVITTDEGVPVAKLQDGDTVIFANFRPDRAREISHAICDSQFDGFERTGGALKGIKYYCMTEYDKSLTNVKVVYKKEKVANNLGEFLEKRGYTQLRIAETEKYAHVTFFFNCGEEKPNLNESRILVPSPKVATYDLQPEMSAYEVTDKVIDSIDSKQHDVIILNFANGDMVGHTGNFEAAVSAMETVDECLGKIIDKLEEVKGECIIIADHGNCEQMIDTKTGEPITSHTTFNVPIIVVSDRVKRVNEGTLTDVSPTLIDLMGLNKPKEMTGKSLIEM